MDNPLTGPQGATYTYGPQKGADASALVELESGLIHFAELLRRDCGVDVENMPGAGAAGGLGAGLMACLKAEMHSGIGLFLDIGRFSEKAAEANLVLTGEGSIDAQTLRGKVVSGVLNRCLKLKGPPVIAIGGIVDEQAKEALIFAGLKDVVQAMPAGMTRAAAMQDAAALLSLAASQVVLRITTFPND